MTTRNPYRAHEWRRAIIDIVDDLYTVSEDDDTPDCIRARLAPVLRELVLLANKEEVS